MAMKIVDAKFPVLGRPTTTEIPEFWRAVAGLPVNKAVLYPTESASIGNVKNQARVVGHALGRTFTVYENNGTLLVGRRA